MDALIKAIIAAVKDDAKKVALPIVQQYFSDLASNSTQANVVAKTGKLLVDLQAAIPDLESAVIKDLSNILLGEINTLLAPASALAKAGA